MYRTGMKSSRIIILLVPLRDEIYFTGAGVVTVKYRNLQLHVTNT